MSKIFTFSVVIFAAGALLVGLFVFDLFLTRKPVERVKIAVGGAELFIDVAKTEGARVRGLSGRETLSPDEALLFVFESNDLHAIWMKDMRFSIDIIWIDDNFVIVDIEEGVQPESFPKVFRPEKPARFVLETNAGWARQNGIRAGSVISGIDQLVQN